MPTVPKGFSEVELSGEVVKKPFGRGSKSERMAVYLDAGKKLYVLRRRGGHPFHDPQLEALVGKTIRCKGILNGLTLIISEGKVFGD